MNRCFNYRRAAIYRGAAAAVLVSGITLALGCDEQTEVQRQTHELQEAQKNVAKVTEQLSLDLEQAKADVVRLEQKLAMARQGLTDDVLENQKELTLALQAQEKKVQTELDEASQQAQIHNRDTEAAFRQLSQTTAPNGEPPVAAPEGTVAPAAAPGAPLDSPSADEVVRVHGTDADAGVESNLPTRPGIPETANPNSYPNPTHEAAPNAAPMNAAPPNAAPPNAAPMDESAPPPSPAPNPVPADPGPGQAR